MMESITPVACPVCKRRLKNREAYDQHFPCPERDEREEGSDAR